MSLDIMDEKWLFKNTGKMEAKLKKKQENQWGEEIMKSQLSHDWKNKIWMERKKSK